MLKYSFFMILSLLLGTTQVKAEEQHIVSFPHEKVIQVIRATLAEEQAFSVPLIDDSHIKIALHRPNQEWFLPGESIAWRVALSDLTLSKPHRRFTLTVSFYNKEGALGYQEKVNGRYEEYLEVPVLKQRIGKGEIIQPEWVGKMPINLQRISSEMIKETSQLYGKTARHSLRPNNPILVSSISSAYQILKQSPVNMIYQTGSLFIKDTGIAMEDGTLGEIIRVKNLRSQTIIHALVSAENEVKVTPATLLSQSGESYASMP